jgi:hypothetical protein
MVDSVDEAGKQFIMNNEKIPGTDPPVVPGAGPDGRFRAYYELN